MFFPYLFFDFSHRLVYLLFLFIACLLFLLVHWGLQNTCSVLKWNCLVDLIESLARLKKTQTLKQINMSIMLHCSEANCCIMLQNVLYILAECSVVTSDVKQCLIEGFCSAWTVDSFLTLDSFRSQPQWIGRPLWEFPLGTAARFQEWRQLQLG